MKFCISAFLIYLILFYFTFIFFQENITWKCNSFRPLDLVTSLLYYAILLYNSPTQYKSWPIETAITPPCIHYWRTNRSRKVNLNDQSYSFTVQLFTIVQTTRSKLSQIWNLISSSNVSALTLKQFAVLLY